MKSLNEVVWSSTSDKDNFTIKASNSLSVNCGSGSGSGSGGGSGMTTNCTEAN